MADNQELPVGVPAGNVGNSVGASFKVRDQSLKDLHRTWQLLINDVKEFNRQLGGIGKQPGISALLGMRGGGGGSGGHATLSAGGFGTPMPSAGGQPAASPVQHPAEQAAGSDTLSRGKFSVGGRIATGIGATVGGLGAYYAHNFSDMASMNFQANQIGQGALGGYSMATQNNAQRAMAGMGGYRNAQDLTAGVSMLTPFAGSFGSKRYSGVMAGAGNLAALNPALGLQGAAQAVGSMYMPQTNYALTSMGMGGSIGAGGGLRDPQSIAQSILTRIYRGKPWTAQMITEGMHPGSPLEISLRMLDPQTAQYVAQYGIAVANLGGDPKKVNQALQSAAHGHTTALTRQAGLTGSMISHQNTLGRAATGLASNMSIDAAGTFNTAVDSFASAVRAFGDIAGHGGGALGAVGMGGMLASNAGSRVLGMGGGYLGYHILGRLGSAIGGRLRGRAGTVARAVGSSGVGGALAAEASGATPVYVVNMPGGGLGGSGGGLGGSPTDQAAEKGAQKLWQRIAGRFGGAGAHAASRTGIAAGAADAIPGVTGVGTLGAGVAGGAMVAAPVVAAVGAGLLINQGITDRSVAEMGLQGSGAGLLTALLRQARTWGLTNNPRWSAEYNRRVRALVIRATSTRKQSDQEAAANALRSLNHQFAAQGARNVARQKRNAYASTFHDPYGSDPWNHGQAGGSNTSPTATGGVTYPQIEAMLKAGPKHIVTSTTGGQHATNSYHYRGEAVDFADKVGSVDSPGLLAINQYLARNYGHELAELIYAGPGGINIKDGKVVSGTQVFGADIMAEHHNHVHAAATPQTLGMKGGVSVAGGNGGTASASAATGITVAATGSTAGGTPMVTGNPSTEEVDAINAILNGYGMGAASAGAAGQAAAGNSGGANSGQGTMGNAKPGWGQAPPSAPSASGAARIGKQMAAAVGWSGSEWDALYQLWQRESGWNANAVNPSSGAYGIPQALGHGHPYNLGDARAQVSWGLNYIKGRYGDPLKAWGHERDVGWYDEGAWKINRDHAAVVHADEMIVPADKARRLRAMATGGGGGGAQSMPIEVHLTAPVTLAGSATVHDADNFVHMVIDRLEDSNLVLAMGSGH